MSWGGGMNCYYFCKKSTCETVAWFFSSSRVCGERKTGFIISQWMGWSRCFSPCVLLQKHVSNGLKYVTIQLNIILNHRNFNLLVVFIKIQADSLSSQASWRCVFANIKHNRNRLTILKCYGVFGFNYLRGPYYLKLYFFSVLYLIDNTF